MEQVTFPSKVWDRDRKECGIPTQTVQRCRLEGCRSVRVGVRWPNGKITWPCMRGMDTSNTAEWRII